LARLVLAISLAAALGLFSRLSWAQDRSTVYQLDPWQPLTVDARSLSVNDRNYTATFSGDVVVTQGAVRMRCASVVIHWEPDRHNLIDRLECDPNYLHLID
jgi:lipopolysaccharide export system protein LptA